MRYAMTLIAFAIAIALLFSGRVAAASLTTQYATGSQDQPLYVDAYPAAQSGARAVIMVHGGQWTSGARDEQRPVQSCNALQTRGVACFSIDYELAPASRWPTQLQNMRDALAWVQAHAHEYGADGSDVSVWGHSSGAHLALMLAYTTPGVRSVVGWSAPTDFTAGWGRNHAKKLLGCDPVICVDTARSASPVYHAHPSVPVLLAHSLGDRSVPYSQATALPYATLHTYPGTKHGGALYAQAFNASFEWWQS